LGSIFGIDRSLDILGGGGGWVVVCGLGDRSGLAGRVGVCGGNGDGSRLGTSCSKICCAVRLLSRLPGLGLLGAGPASGLGLRVNSPSAGLLIYCSSTGQRISISKSSGVLISLLSSDGGSGGDSISMSRPAFLSSSSSFCCSCSGVANVLGGPTRSQVNLWYRPLLLLH